MTPDVLVSFGAPGHIVAHAVSDGLTRRGFRVRCAEHSPLPLSQDLLAVIEETPDFILVEGPGPAVPGAVADDNIPVVAAHAVATNRNIVRVATAGSDPVAGLPAETPRVLYDPAQPAVSIARLAHLLSSEGTVDDRRLMRRAKRLFLLAALILVGGIALQEVPRLLDRWARPRLLEPVPPFALYWAALGQRLEAGRWLSFPVRDGTALAAGDRLRVSFSTSADGYAYVLARTVRGDVRALFPQAGVRHASRVKGGRQQAAPGGTAWLDVDEESMPEVLYVIAGYDAQHNLDELFEEPDGALEGAAQRALIDATLTGLLDGRHGAAERGARTGSLHPIDKNLKIPDVDRRSAFRLADGSSFDASLTPQPGLASACVELRLTRR